MIATTDHRPIIGFAVGLLLLAFFIAGLAAQDPQPSLSGQPSPEPSPSASATPTPPPRIPTPTPFPGAQNAHQWGSVTVFNGLPSDSVRAIEQTPDGVMWFGTDNGLARFDGRRIQKIPVSGNDADIVTVLKTLPTGKLLVGSQDGAWLQLGGRFEIIPNTQGIGITTISTGTETLLGTALGNVLRLTRSDNATNFAAPLLAQPLRAEDGTPLPITSIVHLEGKILAATSGRGVFVIDGGTATELETSPRPTFVNSLAVGSGGQLWLGTEAARNASGVFSAADGRRGEKITAPTSDVFALETNEGGLWAGTERFGLFHFADGKLKKSYTFANTSGGLRSDTIYALFTDREGVLWIGTNRGVSRFDRMGPDQQTVSESANGNFIRTLYDRDGTLLAGSNRGLFEYDGEDWNELPSFRRDTIYALDSPSDDPRITYVGTPNGIFDISGRAIARGDTRSIKEFQGKTYAAVYGRGVFEITGHSPRAVFTDAQVTSLGTSKEKLWIGTEDGRLLSLDGRNANLEIGPETLRSGTVWSILQADDPTGVWIAGQHGVFYVREDSAEQMIAAEDVRDVWADDNGEVWAATTTRGVIHARRDERFGWLSTSIGFEQGLPSEKSFAILPRKESFMFATNRGVVTYNPSTVPPKIIPVRVLSRRVHDLSEIKAPIALEYPQNSLLVEVAGQSSRTFPEEFQYAYVLANSKGEAIDTRVTNDAQYAPNGLPPGDYAVEIIAFDRDLNASEPLTIRFSVATAPFPWTATALGVLLAISLFGLAWAIVEHRRIKLRTNELAAARFDLANEAERERSRIARDLHDQTLADLRNLIINSDMLEGDGSFRTEIESVSTEIRRICEDLSPSVLENVGLVAALEFLLSRTVENGRFHADESADDRIVFPLKVQLQIYRIAQEVLTNISKHSDARVVELHVRIPEPGGLVLSIVDDGKLFQPAGTNGSGRGVANIRSRASLIGARVRWKADDQGRNVFTLKLASTVA